MSKEEPSPTYVRFAPKDQPDGVYHNAVLGELVPGQVIAVRAQDAYVVAGHPDFEKATEKQFETQPPFGEQRVSALSGAGQKEG